MRLLYLMVDEVRPSPERAVRRIYQGQQAMPEKWIFLVESIQIGPPYYEENAVGHALAAPGIIHAVLRHQKDCDAILIACFSDPVVEAARAVSEVPVIGPGEASLVMTQLVARRFGIITILDSTVPEVEALTVRLGLVNRCVGIEVMDTGVTEIYPNVDATAEKLVRAGKRLVEKGADAIVLGCMSFGFHPFADRIREALGVEVIDPLRASIAALQATQTLGTRLGAPAPVLARPDSLAIFMEQLENEFVPL